jgi:predicted RNA-binding Zn-ribbon protein involved in translation (DUF1610 family)
MSESAAAPLLSVEDPAVAEAIVAWLAAQEIEAEVRDGALSDSTGLAPEANQKEVWLRDPEQRALAIQIIEKEAQRLTIQRETEEEYEIVLDCESCGQRMVFSSKVKGTVQECPHCAEYVDIPDPNDEDFDYGQPED